VTPRFAEGMAATKKVVEVLNRVFAVDARGWDLRIVAMREFGHWYNVIAQFDKLYVPGAHASEGLAVGFLVEESHGCRRPIVAFANVSAKGWGCDGLRYGRLVLSIDGFALDVELSSVVGETSDIGTVTFVQALIVYCFGIRITVELSGKGKGKGVVGSVVILMASDVGQVNCARKRAEGSNNGIDDVPVGLKSRIGEAGVVWSLVFDSSK
jgi:hypothetical protein